jgi:hypothetical protein
MATAIKDYSVPTPPLASQFLYAPKESTPERRLLAAVLGDAMRIIRRGPEYHESPWEPNAYRDAIAWVAADRDAWPFCFVALCEALGLDACSVRTRLLGQVSGVGHARLARRR